MSSRTELLTAKVTLPNFPIPVRVDITEEPIPDTPRNHWPLKMLFTVTVRNLKTGEPRPIQSFIILAPYTEPWHLKGIVRAELVKMLAHEVEEALLINGEHVFDPHGTRELEEP